MLGYAHPDSSGAPIQLLDADLAFNGPWQLCKLAIR
jgi:hypothetical protein